MGILCLAQVAIAQPAINYNIDTNGDSIPEGILYRDLVYNHPSSLIVYNDFTPNGSLTYAKDVPLYNGNLTDLTLDVYYCDYGTDSLAARSKPVIFFFYGGGFSEGTSIRVKDLAILFARRGYIAVAPNYRLGFNGAYPEDSVNVCYELEGPSIASYRALLDAQAAMRWVRDSAQAVLGLDVDPSNFFVQGPSLFPMLSHMQSDEVPNDLSIHGVLDDSIKIKASVGRSAAMTTPNLYIDADDTAPFLIFHGTCDKSVPFTRMSVYDRYECKDVLPKSEANVYFLFGSLPIVQAVNHYYEFYPICGLHHSLKDIEENQMMEPMVQFFYNMVADNILPTDPPVSVAYRKAPCDVNGKCTGRDYFNFCNSAIVLPPDNGTCLRMDETDHLEDVLMHKLGGEMNVFPNPSAGPVTLSYRSERAGAVLVQISDALGQLRYSERLQASEGLNASRLSLPAGLESGIYLITIDGKPGPRLVRQ